MAYTYLQEAFDQNDARAKEKFIELFSNCDKFSEYSLHVPNNPYTVDFYVFKNSKHVANIEVEVKNSWTTEKFTYSDIQLLTRKKKFWLDDNNEPLTIPTTFVMFNSLLTSHLAILSHDMCEIYKTNNLRSYGDGYGPSKKKKRCFTCSTA